MKNTTLILSMILIAVLSQACATGTYNYPGEWELLGSRKVNFSADRDEILVTARDGKFRKIRLEIENGSINMHQCIVVFADGSRQNVSLKKTFYKGQSSRVIDLKGGRRVIRKVVMKYDTKNYSGKKAKVRLLGMH